MEDPVRRASVKGGGNGEESILSAAVCAPPAEGRMRRRSHNLPVINPDRLRIAKDLVDKAVKLRKVFSVQGPYPVVRAGLQARGWVERCLPRPAQQWRRRCADEDEEGYNGDDSDDDDGSPDEVEKEAEPGDMYDLMSRLLRNEMIYFYWTTRRDAVDCRMLRREQMTNHYAKAGTFTTKVGLCVNLRNLQWFDAVDPDTFFPRCYRLGAEDEKHAFIEDFRRTACSSLLQCVVERSRGGPEEGDYGGSADPSQPQCRGKTVRSTKLKGHKKPYKHRAMQLDGPRMIESALQVCQDFLDSLDHRDIDTAMETPLPLTDQQWIGFLHKYYLVVHEGSEIENSARYVDRCQAMLRRLREVSPQLDTDGIHNIWIVKPGAKSRGRGIMCVKRLDEILKLVDSDPALIKDSKWVVQKYLERPLLVHGTKFDLRQWFLVTDWNPLTVWFYRECYLRFSTQPYSVETLDNSVHLCNNSIQKHFRPSQLRHPEVPKDNMWSCGQFHAFLCTQGRGALWGTVVVPGMQQAVVHALQTAQDLVESRRGSFELYGADFMLGRDLRPWLIEINASPTMAPSTPITARLCAAVQEDTLRVVLDRRLDRTAPTGGFQLIYKQAAVEVPQYVGMNLLVEGAPLRRPRPALQKSLTVAEPAPNNQPRMEKSGQGLAGKAAETMGKTTKVAISHTRASEVPGHCPLGKENRAEDKVKNPVVALSSKRGWGGPASTRKFTVSTLKLLPRVALDRSALTMQPKKLRRLERAGANSLRLPRCKLSRSVDRAWTGSQHSHVPRPGTARPLQPTLYHLVHAPRSLPILPRPSLTLEVISLQSGLSIGARPGPRAMRVSCPGPFFAHRAPMCREDIFHKP